MIKLFILGFPEGKDEQWYFELFSKHGAVLLTEIVKDQALLKCLGYGFITMGDQAAADRAIALLNNSVVDGHVLSIRIVKP